MKTKILQILRNTKGYVSGQQLCDELGVSRTAVWKVINQLKEEGYEIEAVRNRGYRILAAADVLDDSEIKSRLCTHHIGSHVYYQSEIDSTNSWLKRLAEDGAVDGSVAIADMQSRGKGRRGRVWETPLGTSVPFSVLLRPDIRPERASMLTLVMGLCVARAIQELYGLDTGIKWPNDVVVKGRKICGILTEMTMQAEYIDSVIIGVGINANMQEFSPDLADKATSLRNELGRPVKRADIVVKTLEIFEDMYRVFLQTQDLTGLIDDYQGFLLNKDKEVRVLQPGDEYEGVARGIDELGNLIVERKDNGRTEKVYAGEVSVRGLYSYV